jgi:excisionase family DNA binding protein
MTRPIIVEPAPRRWARLNEAAAYVCVSRRTIEREIAAGRLARHKVGRRVLVDLNELDALLVGRR